MARKQFILAAGVDWSDFKINFEKLCLTRIDFIVRENRGDFLRFVIFNFQSGQVREIEYGSNGKKQTDAVIKRFVPVSILDYNHYTLDDSFYIEFVGNTTGKLSITEIYDEVIRIGKGSPGELQEMSWFYLTGIADLPQFTRAHSTVFIGDKRTAIRSINSLDPYPEIDFLEVNMSPENKSFFQKAFSQGGLIWLWNADKTDFLMNSLQRETAVILGKKFSQASADLDDKTIVDLTILDSPDRYFFIHENLPWAFNGKIPHELMTRMKDMGLYPFSAVRTAFYYYLIRSNAYRLCKATGIKVAGNNFLSFTEFPSSVASGLPSVDPSVREINAFCSRFFDLSLDKEGRGYLIFNPGITAPAIPTIEEMESIRPARRRVIASVLSHPKITIPRFTGPDIKPEGLQYIMIAGVDFTFSGIDFLELSRKKIKHILSHTVFNESQIVQFRIYDFRSGSVFYFDRRLPGAPVIDSRFEPITQKDYRKEKDLFGTEQFVFNGKDGAMRIAHIYQDIFKLASENPHSLLELNFICHANETGPLTTNYKESFHTAGTDPLVSATFNPDEIAERLNADEGDQQFFDPSGKSDFSDGFMTDNFESVFRSAWAPSGSVNIWFYNTSESVSKLMRAIVNGPYKLKRKRRPKESALTIETTQPIPELRGTDLIPVALAGYTIDNPYDIVITLTNPDRNLKAMLEKISGQSASPVRMKVRLGHLIYVLGKILRSSYMYRMARAIQVDVYAGIPGVTTGFKLPSKGPYMSIDPAANKKFINFFFAFFDLRVSEVRGDYYNFYTHKVIWEDEHFPGKEYQQG